MKSCWLIARFFSTILWGINYLIIKSNFVSFEEIVSEVDVDICSALRRLLPGTSFPGSLAQSSQHCLGCLLTRSTNLLLLPFPITSTILESALRLKLLWALSQMKSVPLGRHKSSLLSNMLPILQALTESLNQVLGPGWGQW